MSALARSAVGASAPADSARSRYSCPSRKWSRFTQNQDSAIVNSRLCWPRSGAARHHSNAARRLSCSRCSRFSHDTWSALTSSGSACRTSAVKNARCRSLRRSASPDCSRRSRPYCTHGLEQPIPPAPVDIVVDVDERLVHEPRQELQDLVPFDAVTGRDILRGLDRPAADEHRQPSQQLALRAPKAGRNSSPRWPRACAGGRPTVRLPPVSRRKRSSAATLICSTDRTLTRAAASSIASGMPSSRRQTSATAAALAVGQRRTTGRRRRRARRTSAPRRSPRSVSAATGVTRFGKSQRRHPPGGLAGDAEPLAARRQRCRVEPRARSSASAS